MYMEGRREERKGETRRDEAERYGFKKEMRDGGGEESGCRKNVKEEEDEPDGNKGQNM